MAADAAVHVLLVGAASAAALPPLLAHLVAATGGAAADAARPLFASLGSGGAAKELCLALNNRAACGLAMKAMALSVLDDTWEVITLLLSPGTREWQRQLRTGAGWADWAPGAYHKALLRRAAAAEAAAGCGAASCARPLPADVEERMQAAVARMLRGAGEAPERDGLTTTGARQRTCCVPFLVAVLTHATLVCPCSAALRALAAERHAGRAAGACGGACGGAAAQ
jgi:hypothetical protein